ncbi:MAG TPA: mandelate racemase/muconate lactonizing enzyme family protein [Chloroflexota bacterium]|nr:mandelate racemase/muconate lactonizing enzyme family protein [Chloroflexota bacterium]
MRITRVETLPIDRYLFVQVHTDAGLTGLGEAGTWGYLEAAEQVVAKWAHYLVGEDPLRIEHHWNYLYRSTHFRGSAIMGALSAIDIALWDIAGKQFGVPVYQLLGGKTRHTARVYYHVLAETVETLVSGCIQARARGFTAVGHLSPFADEPRSQPYFKTHAAKIGEAIDAVRQFREAVGDDVDLCIEIHRRLTPAEAIELARGIERYHPMFYEDPILPDNFDAMGLVAENIHIPIATGERLHTIQEFEMLLRRGAVQFVRPDVCLCGGITGAKKVAALAEASYVGVVPHNPLSPVSTAACVQLAACIPNFTIQEYPTGEDQPPKSEIVKTVLEYDGHGSLVVPDAPGIGVELAPDAAQRHPYKMRWLGTRLNADGSVMDQ